MPAPLNLFSFTVWAICLCHMPAPYALATEFPLFAMSATCLRHWISFLRCLCHMPVPQRRVSYFYHICHVPAPLAYAIEFVFFATCATDVSHCITAKKIISYFRRVYLILTRDRPLISTLASTTPRTSTRVSAFVFHGSVFVTPFVSALEVTTLQPTCVIARENSGRCSSPICLMLCCIQFLGHSSGSISVLLYSFFWLAISTLRARYEAFKLQRVWEMPALKSAFKSTCKP